jgi:hypothetical protein
MEGLFRFATLAAALALCLFAAGCIHSDIERSGMVDGHFWCERVADQPSQSFVEELTSELLTLGSNVSEDEATRLADVSVRHSEVLRRRWRMVKPIELHNMLVNLGLRPRGLCYQCAEAMYLRLRDLDLKTFDLHWGVAHKGDLWLEHSGVIVTQKGRPFSEGLVLDAWRHSGRLRWARVQDDRYPWVEMIKWKFTDPAASNAKIALARRTEERHVLKEGLAVRDKSLADEAAHDSTQRAGIGAAAARGSVEAVSSKQLSAMVTTRSNPQ